MRKRHNYLTHRDIPILLLGSLNLSGNDLSGTIPDELGNLAILSELRLHDNDLTGIVPKDLGNLKSLRKSR
jgi:Leucine-rich repeat (LRR) protein